MRDNEMIAIIATVFCLMLPVVALILTYHQQKMAQIIHQGQQRQRSEEALQQEIEMLRNQLAQQTIMLDSMVQSQRALSQRLDSEIEFHQRMGA